MVPHHHHLPSSSKSTIVPHDTFQGVYVGNAGYTLYTRNLLPGLPNDDDDDDVVISVQDSDGTTDLEEYRKWNPFKSKVAAAILSGAQNLWISGMVYVVETCNTKTLANMADKRFNIVPIILNTTPHRLRMLINSVDVLFATVYNPDQVRHVYLNAMYFLKTGGHYMLYVQVNFMESTSRYGDLFASLGQKVHGQFKQREQVNLEPFDADHSYVIGAFRMLEMDERICLETISAHMSQTAHNSNSRDGERGGIYEMLKDLPTYMLFESSCGIALFRAHDLYKIERNFVATEDYINRFDSVLKLIAYRPFDSTSDALIYLDAICNETLYDPLIEFLVHNLPTPREGGKHLYSLLVASAVIADHILFNTGIACSASLFHEEILRGVRMHIDKFIKELKPGDLEKAQLEIARNHCKQKLTSPEKGKSQKKRGGFQASILSRKNPMKKGLADAKTTN